MPKRPKLDTAFYCPPLRGARGLARLAAILRQRWGGSRPRDWVFVDGCWRPPKKLL